MSVLVPGVVEIITTYGMITASNQNVPDPLRLFTLFASSMPNFSVSEAETEIRVGK